MECNGVNNIHQNKVLCKKQNKYPVIFCGLPYALIAAHVPCDTVLKLVLCHFSQRSYPDDGETGPLHEVFSSTS